MAVTTVAQLAAELNRPAATLLEQLHSAGVPKAAPEDVLTEADKERLLDHLRHAHGSTGGDRKKITLTATADGSVTTADTSVSLGLIVTELVINALKHAFPDGRAGAITVYYAARGSDWTLSVGDDGVGIATNPDDAKAGLGTSIIQALSRQLGAQVQVATGKDGTKVSVVHTYTPVLVGQAAQAAARPV